MGISDWSSDVCSSDLERGVSAAWVSVIGAVQRAAFAYYHQTDHRYLELSSETHHEIVGFIGNVSLREGKPFLHAHATFADEHGACVGGHLLRGGGGRTRVVEGKGVAGRVDLGG